MSAIEIGQDKLIEATRWARFGGRYKTTATHIAPLKTEEYADVVSKLKHYDEATGYCLVSGMNPEKTRAVVNEFWIDGEQEYWWQKASQRELVQGTYSDPYTDYISLEIGKPGEALRKRYVMENIGGQPVAQIQVFMCPEGLARSSIAAEIRLAMMTYREKDYPMNTY